MSPNSEIIFAPIRVTSRERFYNFSFSLEFFAFLKMAPVVKKTATKFVIDCSKPTQDGKLIS
jgi:hypothetical protein